MQISAWLNLLLVSRALQCRAIWPPWHSLVTVHLRIFKCIALRVKEQSPHLRAFPSSVAYVYTKCLSHRNYVNTSLKHSVKQSSSEFNIHIAYLGRIKQGSDELKHLINFCHSISSFGSPT